MARYAKPKPIAGARRTRSPLTVKKPKPVAGRAPVKALAPQKPPATSPPAAPAKTNPTTKTPVDPLRADIDTQYNPAYAAIEKQRLIAQADRDAALRDRAAFDEWAKADRERRVGMLKDRYAASAADVAAGREKSNQVISGSIEAAMSKLGGLGGDALKAAGLSDAFAGARSGMAVSDALDAANRTHQTASLEREDARSRADRAYGDTLAARAAAQYGRRTSELDAARLGLDQRKADAYLKARDARAAAQAKAQEDAWMRQYLTGKAQDAFTLGKARIDATVRGQDIADENADLTRQAQYSAPGTGYKGLNADQYTKLRDSWYTRISKDLDPGKYTVKDDLGNPSPDPVAHKAAAYRQLGVLVGAGLRPMDAVAMVDNATGGQTLSESEYRDFLRLHLPSANVDKVLHALFGTPIPKVTTAQQKTSADQMDRLAAARKAKTKPKPRKPVKTKPGSVSWKLPGNPLGKLQPKG